MQSIWRAALLAAALVFAGAGPADAEPLRLGVQSWVAPGPFFVAETKGWFAEEGVEVELVRVEDIKVRVASLSTGDLDAMVGMVDGAVLHMAPGLELRFLFAVSESRGADGLAALRAIDSVAGLKGRTVALEPGTTGQFYLNMLLREAGLDQSDVQVVAMAPGQAGHAFEVGEVDAAVTWEPWLSRTRQRSRGHVLADTTDRPALLIEAVAAPAAVAQKRLAEFRGLYRAWLRAVAFIRENPEEADRIMAKGLGAWLRHRDVVHDIRAGIAWYDSEANAALFGAPETPGPLVDAVARAIAVWGDFGKLQVKVGANGLVTREVVTE